jgi:hypothetical protein
MEEKDKQQPEKEEELTPSDVGISKEEEKKLFLGIMKSHTNLVKWLYDNHLDVLREYEALQGNLRIHFLQEIWNVENNKSDEVGNGKSN